jgi:hypothetical protein
MPRHGGLNEDRVSLLPFLHAVRGLCTPSCLAITPPPGAKSVTMESPILANMGRVCVWDSTCRATSAVPNRRLAATVIPTKSMSTTSKGAAALRQQHCSSSQARSPHRSAVLSRQGDRRLSSPRLLRFDQAGWQRSTTIDGLAYQVHRRASSHPMRRLLYYIVEQPTELPGNRR